MEADSSWRVTELQRDSSFSFRMKSDKERWKTGNRILETVAPGDDAPSLAPYPAFRVASLSLLLYKNRQTKQLSLFATK
jgi:hypothetical protein